MTRVDINCDMGESGLLAADEALMPYLTSVNVACGGHAGDAATMAATAAAARRHGLAVGAHPGYPDRENFGRVRVAMTAEELVTLICAQLAALAEAARPAGVELSHVKPHGALYSAAAEDAALAKAVAAGVLRFGRRLVVVGPPGSQLLRASAARGLRTAAEGFADRRYEPDGTLRPRGLPGALIRDPAEAARQAVALVKERRVDTLCVHSDTPGARDILAAVAAALAAAGVARAPLRPR